MAACGGCSHFDGSIVEAAYRGWGASGGEVGYGGGGGCSRCFTRDANVFILLYDVICEAKTMVRLFIARCD